MNTKNILVGFLAMGLLAACSMSAPSQISISPIEVKQTTYRQAWPIGAFDENRVGGLADYYTRYGDGPLRLTLTYADNQKDAKVRAEINKLADRLRHQGPPMCLRIYCLLPRARKQVWLWLILLRSRHKRRLNVGLVIPRNYVAVSPRMRMARWMNTILGAGWIDMLPNRWRGLKIFWDRPKLVNQVPIVQANDLRIIVMARTSKI